MKATSCKWKNRMGMGMVMSWVIGYARESWTQEDKRGGPNYRPLIIERRRRRRRKQKKGEERELFSYASNDFSQVGTSISYRKEKKEPWETSTLCFTLWRPVLGSRRKKCDWGEKWRLERLMTIGSILVFTHYDTCGGWIKRTETWRVGANDYDEIVQWCWRLKRSRTEELLTT